MSESARGATEDFHPWKNSAEPCKANKILVMEMKDKKQHYVPIVSAEKTIDNLLTSFKTAMDPELKKMTEMEPKDRLPFILKDILETCQKTKPLYMEHMLLTDRAKKAIDEKNKTGTEKPFNYDQVLNNGFHAKKIGEEVDLDNPCSEKTCAPTA